ncbi:MAG: DNA/RNA nuclease SfsA [Bacillota bacterium]
MKFKNVIKKAEFIKRLNRFEALVMLDGREELVHVPNTGRCRELFIEGTGVLLEDRRSKSRKTDYELVVVYKNGLPVSIDSQLPNALAQEGIRRGIIKELIMYGYIKREVTYSGSRFDLLLKKHEDSVKKSDCCFVEIKGVTLEKDSIAMFPDAPTERGKRHIYELIKARKEGYKSALLFVVQLDFAHSFTPNYVMDPAFGKAVKQAEAEGVCILAYKCTVNNGEVEISNKIDVII